MSCRMQSTLTGSAPHGQPAFARAAIPDGQPLVLFVGHSFQRKGLDRVIDALAGVPDAHLLVVGEDDRSVVTGLILREGLTGRVHFAGRVDDPERYYIKADFLVPPTRSRAVGDPADRGYGGRHSGDQHLHRRCGACCRPRVRKLGSFSPMSPCPRCVPLSVSSSTTRTAGVAWENEVERRRHVSARNRMPRAVLRNLPPGAGRCGFWSPLICGFPIFAGALPA